MEGKADIFNKYFANQCTINDNGGVFISNCRERLIYSINILQINALSMIMVVFLYPIVGKRLIYSINILQINALSMIMVVFYPVFIVGKRLIYSINILQINALSMIMVVFLYPIVGKG